MQNAARPANKQTQGNAKNACATNTKKEHTREQANWWKTNASRKYKSAWDETWKIHA